MCRYRKEELAIEGILKDILDLERSFKQTKILQMNLNVVIIDYQMSKFLSSCLEKSVINSSLHNLLNKRASTFSGKNENEPTLSGEDEEKLKLIKVIYKILNKTDLYLINLNQSTLHHGLTPFKQSLKSIKSSNDQFTKIVHYPFTRFIGVMIQNSIDPFVVCTSC